MTAALARVEDEARLAEALCQRVRARAEQAEGSDERRRCVLDLMLDQVWSTGVHAPICAEVWTIEESSVIGIATEVGRWRRIFLGSEGEALLRERLAAKTHEILGRVHTAGQLRDVGTVALPLAGVSQRVEVKFDFGGVVVRGRADEAAGYLARFGAWLREKHPELIDEAIQALEGQ